MHQLVAWVARRAGYVRRRPWLFVSALLPLLLLSVLAAARPAAAQDAPTSLDALPAEMRQREAQLLELVNRERRAAGLLPLRWNRELSEAAAWFARDTTERAIPICGHEDTLGRGVSARVRAFGYTNPRTYGEVVVCGFTEPRAAVQAWMYDAPRRSVLLHPEAREAGAGYYFSVERQRGYVVFDVSMDETFAPAVLNDEAVATSSTEVQLTTHAPGESLPRPTHMKISNHPNFEGAPWLPYATERSWTLDSGSGWRTVYVLTRDSLGRTALVTDTIYLGASAPAEQISLDQATNIGSAFAITALPAVASDSVRLSMGWQVDSAAFTVYRGPSVTVDDPGAVGGSALLLAADDREGIARAETYDLPVNRMLTAYVRLRASENRGDGEVARLVVRAGDRDFGPLILKASDFLDADVYQEFTVNFAYPMTPASALAQVTIYRTGEADVTVDVVRFFGQPMAAETPLVWSAGGGNIRNRGVWARSEAAGQLFDVTFAPVDNARRLPGQQARLVAEPNRILFSATAAGEVTPANAAMVVCGLWCDSIRWEATTNASWLTLLPSPEGVLLTANSQGLARGVYYAVVTITPLSQAETEGTNLADALAPAQAQVELRVDGAEPLADSEIVSRVFLPMTMDH